MIFSYTFFSAYDTCPHRGYRQYVARDLPKERKSAAQISGIETHGAFEQRIRNSTPLPAHLPYEHLVEPLVRYGATAEVKLGVTRAGKPCDFFAEDVFLRGVLDAPIVVGSQALLVDWKTGNPKYEDPFELEIGALLLQASKPEVRKITGRYAWLREGRLGREFDCSNTLQTWNTVNAKAREVETATEWPKTPGPLCGRRRNGQWESFCPVKDCEHNR